MPEQAILDLPLVEFEALVDSPDALNRLCIRTYGLAGLSPHPDAVFHFTASLWRYRRNQSLFSLATLALCHLGAVSAQIGAERRLQLLESRAAVDAEAAAGLEPARQELAAARRRLALAIALVFEIGAETPDDRADRNLDLMAEPSWREELEDIIPRLLYGDAWRADLSGRAAEVLQRFDDNRDELAPPCRNRPPMRRKAWPT